MQDFNKQISMKLKDLKNSFPSYLLEKHFLINSELKKKYSEKHIEHYKEDTSFHLSYLAEAIQNKEPVLFNEYLGWIKDFFNNSTVTYDEILTNLELLRDELTNILSEEMFKVTTEYINLGINYYKSKYTTLSSFIRDDNPHKEIAIKYLNFLIDGDKKSAHDLIMNAFRNNITIKDLYLNVFQATQKETGRLWQMSKITVAQEHFITAATQLIMAQLYPYLFSSTKKEKSIIVACVEGELHELGARMVADIFELEGWSSYYFGASTPLKSILSSIRIYNPKIVAISSTMVYNLSHTSDIIQKIKEENKNIKILVGGYPFSIAKNLWRNIGADGFANDASSAVNLANEIIN